MTDSNPNCFYHPDRDAITKCEMCNRVICVECKNVFQQRHRRPHSSDRSMARSYYYTRHELCTPCFIERKIKYLQTPFNYCQILFGIIFVAVAIFMTYGFMSFSGPSSPGFFVIVPIAFICIGIGIVILGIKNRLTAPQRVEALNARKADFLKNISPASASYDDSKYKACPYCGDKIDIDEKICDKCGSEVS